MDGQTPWEKGMAANALSLSHLLMCAMQSGVFFSRLGNSFLEAMLVSRNPGFLKNTLYLRGQDSY